MVRRWGWVPLVLVAVGMLVVPRPAAAGAAPPDAHGYWWRLQSGVGPELTPPGVPEGGLWVTADPSGDQAISALRLTPPTGSKATVLRLRTAEVVGTPTVAACPAAARWEPADGGSWDARPDARCDLALVKATLADGLLSVPLARFGEGPIDLVLVPDADTAGYFSVSFEPPGRKAFTIGPASTRRSTPATTPPTAAPGAAPVPTVAPRPAPVTYEAPAAAFATPAFEPPPPPHDPVAAPAPSERPTTPAAASGPARPAPEPFKGSREPLAAVALLLIAGGWAYRSRAALRDAAAHPLAAGNVAFAREQA